MGNWVWWVIGAAAVGGVGYWAYTQSQAASTPTPSPTPPAPLPPAVQPYTPPAPPALPSTPAAPASGFVSPASIPATTGVLSNPTVAPYTINSIPPNDSPAGFSRRMAREELPVWSWNKNF